MTDPRASHHAATAADADAEMDDPSALPPRLARRAGRSRIPWGMLLLEATFTVVAILLALAADDWRQRREERALVRDALSAFDAELSSNRERLNAARPYHESLHVAMNAALSDTTGRVYRSPRDVFPEWRGTRPAFVTHAAWETAIATGALRYIPADALRGLAMTYELQSRLDALNRSMYAVILQPDVIAADDFGVPMRITAAYLSDIVPIERELSNAYGEMIWSLRRGAGP